MAEIDPFVSANTGYSIVIAGSMNPAIHHPAWYRLNKALSEEELASTGALGENRQGVGETSVAQWVLSQGSPTNATICTPAFSQFTAGKIRIACIQQSWTITTIDRSLFVRIREVASAVFDILTHTPISAYGLNFNFHRKTSEKDLGSRLAQIIDDTGIGILKGVSGSRSAKLGYTVSTESRALNVSVERSVRGADTIFVGINAHHPIVMPPGVTQFDLTPLLRDSSDDDLRDAEEVLAWAIRTFGGNGKQ